LSQYVVIQSRRKKADEGEGRLEAEKTKTTLLNSKKGIEMNVERWKRKYTVQREGVRATEE